MLKEIPTGGIFNEIISHDNNVIYAKGRQGRVFVLDLDSDQSKTLSFNEEGVSERKYIYDFVKVGNQIVTSIGNGRFDSIKNYSLSSIAKGKITTLDCPIDATTKYVKVLPKNDNEFFLITDKTMRTYQL